MQKRKEEITGPTRGTWIGTAVKFITYKAGDDLRVSVEGGSMRGKRRWWSGGRRMKGGEGL